MYSEKSERPGPEEDPIELIQEFSVHTMANVIASHADIDETVAVMTAWYSLHQRPPVLLPPKQLRGFYRQPKSVRYNKKKNRFKKLLMLQQKYGGDAGGIGAPTLEETDLTIEFNFPIHNFIEQLAEYYDVSVIHMKEKFREQLEKAYTELMETGEGRLKDFGVLYHGEGGPMDLIFDINEEVRAILSSESETENNGNGKD